MAGDSSKRDTRKAGGLGSWRLISPVPVLVGSLVAGLGILVPIYLATNTELSGLRFLSAILLASIALVLLVESTHRARSKRQWRAVGGIGIVAGLVSLLIALTPVSDGNASAGGGGLRLKARPTAPDLFHIAFQRQIPQPSAREDWAELRRRGGVDVGDSRFHLILANESSEPISVLNVHAEVLDSEPMPRGTDTWEASQGDEGVGQLTALLLNDDRGSIGRVYDSSAQMIEPGNIATASPYFQSKYILLKPGEVYPAMLTVIADVPRTISYRMVAEGESAQRRFVVKTPAYKIVGRFDDPYQHRFARYYAKGYQPTDCTPTPDNPWVDARNAAQSKACPYGLGRAYEIPLRNPSRYPSGKFGLSLGLTPGKQSATISGVVVGGEPAATPQPGVVRPLLQALGAWSSCTRYLPSTSYWMARWVHWNVDLIFESQDDTDCTPASSAPLREIELGESRALIHTDLGPIELGSPAAWLPPQIAEILTAGERVVLERELVAPGVSACDPTRVVPTRTQLDDSSPGGILALSENLTSNELTGLTTTLPDGDC
jgi:hypothetical protein